MALPLEFFLYPPLPHSIVSAALHRTFWYLKSGIMRWEVKSGGQPISKFCEQLICDINLALYDFCRIGLYQYKSVAHN